MAPMTDSVCGMTVDPATAAGSTTYNGVTYNFCSKGCLRRFEGDPDAGREGGPAVGGLPAGDRA